MIHRISDAQYINYTRRHLYKYSAEDMGSTPITSITEEFFMGRKKKVVAAPQLDDSMEVYRPPENHMVDCKICHIESEWVSADVGAIICDTCVSMLVGPPEIAEPPKPATGYPRGWHLRTLFISDEGNYFSKGVELSNKERKALENATPKPKLAKGKKSKSSRSKDK